MQCHGSIYRYTSTIYTVYRYLTGRHADTLFRRRYRYKRGKIPPCESSCDLTGTRAALPSSPNSSLLNLCPFMARHCNRAPVLFDYGTPVEAKIRGWVRKETGAGVGVATVRWRLPGGARKYLPVKSQRSCTGKLAAVRGLSSPRHDPRRTPRRLL